MAVALTETLINKILKKYPELKDELLSMDNLALD